MTPLLAARKTADIDIGATSQIHSQNRQHPQDQAGQKPQPPIPPHKPSLAPRVRHPKFQRKGIDARRFRDISDNNYTWPETRWGPATFCPAYSKAILQQSMAPIVHPFISQEPIVDCRTDPFMVNGAGKIDSQLAWPGLVLPHPRAKVKTKMHSSMA